MRIFIVKSISRRKKVLFGLIIEYVKFKRLISDWIFFRVIFLWWLNFEMREIYFLIFFMGKWVFNRIEFSLIFVKDREVAGL